MSVESEIRAALVAYAPLLAVVPAARISVDALPESTPMPYIAFSKQGEQRELGLGGAVLGIQTTMDLQCVADTRSQAIAVADLVRAALAAVGQPSASGSGAYDPELQVEVEVVSTTWLTG